MTGAVTMGFPSSQAMAMIAEDTPSFSATSAHRAAISKSLSPRYKEAVRCLSAPLERSVVPPSRLPW